MKQFAALSALMVLAFASCRTPPTDVSAVSPLGPVPSGLAALDAGGRWMVEVESGSLESEFGCTIVYERYTPAQASGANTRPAVLLAHGFLRDLEHMRGWAELWASFGVETIIPSFCNSRLTNGNHDRNAADLRRLADTVLGPDRPVVYAGYSAGGLSALLAATADIRAVAYLGLDPVDSGGLASELDTVDVPTAYLFGESSDCNAEQNMAEVIPQSPLVRTVFFRYATHCDFEAPTDSFCKRLCGEIIPPEAEETVRLAIRTAASAWVLQATGVLPLDSLSEDLVSELRRGGLVY